MITVLLGYDFYVAVSFFMANRGGGVQIPSSNLIAYISLLLCVFCIFLKLPVTRRTITQVGDKINILYYSNKKCTLVKTNYTLNKNHLIELSLNSSHSTI